MVQDAGSMLLVVVPGSLPNGGRHGHYSISSRYKRLHEPEDLSRHVLLGRCQGGDRNVHEGMPTGPVHSREWLRQSLALLGVN